MILPDRDTHFRDPERYQHSARQAAIGFCKRRKLAIDVGAHVGTWTVPLAKAFDRVVALEPDTDNFRCLEANVTGRNVECVQAAAGNRNGSVCLVRDSDTNTGAIHTEAGENVRLIQIDSLMLDPDFVKIDVQGDELAVLNGMFTTLVCKPVLCIETVLGNVYDGLIASFLHAFGYRETLRIGKDSIFTVPA